MRRTFKGDQAHFIPVNAEIARPENVPLPSQVVEKIIREAPFRFILNRCLCRSLESCQHFPRELGCLFLGEGAREIDPHLGRQATVAEALNHHRQAVARGLIPMAGKLRKRSQEETLMKEMVISGILAIANGENPRLVEEKLHSFIPPSSRGSRFR